MTKVIYSLDTSQKELHRRKMRRLGWLLFTLAVAVSVYGWVLFLGRQV